MMKHFVLAVIAIILADIPWDRMHQLPYGPWTY